MRTETQLDSLRHKIDTAGPWFHTIDFGDGLLSPGVTPLEVISRNAAIYLSDVAGKTVLDVGCWDGAYSFEARRRGASRVVAADYFVWQSRGEVGRGNKDAFDLANSELGLNVEPVVLDLPDLKEETIGRFDVVLFNGIIYHHFDPFAPLKQLAALCNETLTIETLMDCRHETRPMMVFFPGEKMTGEQRTNGWGMNLRLLYDLMLYLGFAAIEYYPTPGCETTRAILKAHKPGVRIDSQNVIRREQIQQISAALMP